MQLYLVAHSFRRIFEFRPSVELPLFVSPLTPVGGFLTTSCRNHLKLGLQAHLLRDEFGEVHPASSFLLRNPILFGLNATFDYSRYARFIAASPSQTWLNAEMLYAVKSISSGRDYLQIKPFAALRANGF